MSVAVGNQLQSQWLLWLPCMQFSFQLLSGFIILHLFSAKSDTELMSCKWCKQCITIKKLKVNKLGKRDTRRCYGNGFPYYNTR